MIIQDIVNLRLAIISPQPLITYGLARMFEDDPRLTIVRESDLLADLRELLSASNPDVTLIDWELMTEEAGTMDLIRKASHRTRILFLMHTPAARECRIALEIGGRGALGKNSAPGAIRKAVWKVFKGGIWVERAAAEAVLEHALSPSSPLENDRRRIEWLTRRERQIVELVCMGYRNKRVAAELSIAETTVCHHLSSVFSKLDVEDRMGLMLFAHRHALNLTINNHRPHSRDRGPRSTRKPKVTAKAAPAFQPPPLQGASRPVASLPPA